MVRPDSRETLFGNAGPLVSARCGRSWRQLAVQKGGGYHDINDWRRAVAQLIVRNLEDDVKEKLRQRADRHGRSTEEEVRDILRNAVRSEGGTSPPLGSRLAARFARIGLTSEIEELRGEDARPASVTK